MYQKQHARLRFVVYIENGRKIVDITALCGFYELTMTIIARAHSPLVKGINTELISPTVVFYVLIQN